jgi:galactokinase/mevalonate kinase-like predicted kinase
MTRYAQTPYRLTIPARINLLGNPTDACEGDFAVLSAAVDLYAGALIEPCGEWALEEWERSGDGFRVVRRYAFAPSDLPLRYDGALDLTKGALNRLCGHSGELRERLTRRGFRLALWSDVPRQSGLGGSSLFVLLTLAALRAFYALDPRQHHDYLLAELAQRVEAQEMGIACGFADRYVPLFGGLAYLDCRGKLHQQAIGAEPFATYERLDSWVDDLPLVVISTGLAHDSGNVHGCLRPHYLAEHERWTERAGPPPPMVRWMSAVWETAWRGKIALLARDWVAFGALMDENHRLVDEMMTCCGFPEGVGQVNNLLIAAAKRYGALGAKLTGAGGGGSVFALTRPGEEGALAEAWQRVAADAGLTAARVFRPRLSGQGLVVTEAESKEAGL